MRLAMIREVSRYSAVLALVIPVIAENGFASRKEIRWIFIPPLIHLTICLIAMLGYIAPSLQFLGIMWSIITIADIPVSLITIVLALRSDLLAALWATVAGTAWWYLLCRAAEFLATKVRAWRKV